MSAQKKLLPNSLFFEMRNFKHSIISNKLKSFTNELSEVSDETNFNLRGENDSFKLSEVKIPRIQFKPGYQRM
jgi:hypothetical protein